MAKRNAPSEGMARHRLRAVQKIVRELAEMKSAKQRLKTKMKAVDARIKELEAALQLESIDVAGESTITAGESNGDIVGKIGGAE